MSEDENCVECGKPLGSTIEKCHECGGGSTRGGKAIPPHNWQLRLGVPAEKLKDVDFKARRIGTEAWEESH